MTYPEGEAPDVGAQWDNPTKNIYETLKFELPFSINCNIFPSIAREHEEDSGGSEPFDVIVFIKKDDAEFQQAMTKWGIDSTKIVEAEDDKIPQRIHTILGGKGFPVGTVIVRLLDDEVVTSEIVRLEQARTPYAGGMQVDEKKKEEAEYAQATLAVFFSKTTLGEGGLAEMRDEYLKELQKRMKGNEKERSIATSHWNTICEALKGFENSIGVPSSEYTKLADTPGRALEDYHTISLKRQMELFGFLTDATKEMIRDYQESYALQRKENRSGMDKDLRVAVLKDLFFTHNRSCEIDEAYMFLENVKKGVLDAEWRYNTKMALK